MVDKKPNVKLIFPALMLTILMSSLSQMIFNTALPTIVGELGGVDHMSWVISAFMLAMTIAMPINGKLGDELGRKWLYIGSITLFVIGSTIGGFSQNMAWLIAGRTIQGLGAGGMMVNSQAIVAEIIPARERGKYMGLLGAVFGFSSVLGPVLGGFFTDGPGWRWGMWMNIPLGIIALCVCIAVLHLRGRSESDFSFDWLGAVFMVQTTTSIVLITTQGFNIYLIVLAIVAAALFVIVERSAKNPLIPLHLLANRNMALTTLASIVVGFSLAGVVGYLPTYLQMVHELTPTEAGLMMIPMVISLVGFGTFVGFVISKTGRYKIYPITGLAVVAISLFLFSRMHVGTTLVVLGFYILLFGIGLGMVLQILVLIVQNSFPVAVVGTATATTNFFRQLGSALGGSLVGSLFIHNLTNNLSGQIPETAGSVEMNKLTPDAVSHLSGPIHDIIINAYNDALTPVFLLMAPLALLAMLLLVPVREEPLKETVD